MAGKWEEFRSVIFNVDSGVMHFFGRVCDLVVLNLVFLLCCIPIVTIGPALTALYSVTLKMARNEEGRIVGGFFKAFKENFRQGAFFGIIATALAVFLCLDLIILGNTEGMEYFKAVCYGAGLLGYLIFLYIFPVLARFVYTIKETFRNALLMCIVNLKYSLLIAAINVPVVVMLLYSGLTLYIMASILLVGGFSSVALLQSKLFRKVFEKYELSGGETELESMY